MPNMDFNKGMDDYMKRRSKSSDYTYLDESEPTPEPQPVPISEDTSYDEPMEPAQDAPRKGFFSRVKGFFSSEEDEPPVHQEYDEPAYDPREEIREDLRALGKITLNVLRLLPDRELVSFKNSDEYLKLKDILAKNNLVKTNTSQ